MQYAYRRSRVTRHRWRARLDHQTTRMDEPVTFHTPDSTADIDHRFNFHPADVARSAQHSKTRAACAELAHQLDRELPAGREKALALTQLEQAMFWANAAIARAR